VGVEVGAFVGKYVSPEDVGVLVGADVGDVGAIVGALVDGEVVGAVEGAVDGAAVGTAVGTAVVGDVVVGDVVGAVEGVVVCADVGQANMNTFLEAVTAVQSTPLNSTVDAVDNCVFKKVPVSSTVSVFGSVSFARLVQARNPLNQILTSCVAPLMSTVASPFIPSKAFAPIFARAVAAVKSTEVTLKHSLKDVETMVVTEETITIFLYTPQHC
jgi:hypothetical protein